MKRLTLYSVLLLSIAFVAAPHSAFAFFGVEAGVGVWNESPSGTFGYKPLTATDNLDLKNDLGFKDASKTFFRVKAELPLILPNLYFMSTPMSFDASGNISRQISYGNTTFPINDPIKSKLKLDHMDLAIYYPIPLLKTATLGVLNVELGLNARKIDFDGTIQDATQTASKKLTVYAPMVYAGVQVKPISMLSAEVEFRGVSVSQSHYYDYIGRVKYSPIPVVFIGAGYRSEDIKIDQSDVKTAVKFSGPFMEAGVSF
jgi:outer membrane protein